MGPSAEAPCAIAPIADMALGKVGAGVSDGKVYDLSGGLIDERSTRRRAPDSPEGGNDTRPQLETGLVKRLVIRAAVVILCPAILATRPPSSRTHRIINCALARRRSRLKATTDPSAMRPHFNTTKI